MDPVHVVLIAVLRVGVGVAAATVGLGRRGLPGLIAPGHRSPAG